MTGQIGDGVRSEGDGDADPNGTADTIDLLVVLVLSSDDGSFFRWERREDCHHPVFLGQL